MVDDNEKRLDESGEREFLHQMVTPLSSALLAFDSLIDLLQTRGDIGGLLSNIELLKV